MVDRFYSSETTLPARLWFPLAAIVLATLLSSCVLFGQSAPEARPIRPGSARDPAGRGDTASSSEPAPIVSLADLSWGWNRDEDGYSAEGISARRVVYERDNAGSRARDGLFQVTISHATIDETLPLWSVDYLLAGFQEALMSQMRSTIDTRSMVNVQGPYVGRRSKWSSVEFTSADGVPTKLFSVVFLEGKSIAVVATTSTRSAARLQDTASLAQDVADRLSGRDTLELPVMKTFGT